jgi:hypothetical protein
MRDSTKKMNSLIFASLGSIIEKKNLSCILVLLYYVKANPTEIWVFFEIECVITRRKKRKNTQGDVNTTKILSITNPESWLVDIYRPIRRLKGTNGHTYFNTIDHIDYYTRNIPFKCLLGWEKGKKIHQHFVSTTIVF